MIPNFLIRVLYLDCTIPEFFREVNLWNNSFFQQVLPHDRTNDVMALKEKKYKSKKNQMSARSGDNRFLETPPGQPEH